MAEKIDLDKSDRGNLYREDADNVFVVEMTVQEARDWFDEMPNIHELTDALDEAQGYVHSRKGARSFFVVKITR